MMITVYRALVALAVLVVSATGAAHGQTSPPLTAPFPGEVVTPPFGVVVFEQPRLPGQPAPTGAPMSLRVESDSDQPATVAYDGITVTITAPSGYVVRILAGCSPAGEPAQRMSCARSPDSQSTLGFPRGPVRFTTLPASQAPPSVALFAGCNNVSLTWPTGTPVREVAAAVQPDAALVAIWRFDNRDQRFAGYSLLPNAPNDYTSVTRLEPVFICMNTAGTLTAPS